MSSAARSRAGAPIVVTGSGVVSPIGNDLATFDAALFGARSAIRPRALDLPGIELPAVPVAVADFDAAKVIAPSRVPLDRATAMALVAAQDAARDAGLSSTATIDRERLGIFWGSGMAGATTFESTCRTVYAERRRMRPTSVVTTMPNAPTAELALRFAARGAALAYACACASSAVAIGVAMRAIRAGWIDIAVAGGSESLLSPGVLASWQAMRVLAPIASGADADETARRACRPFAADRIGFAIGEAAAAFVLESAAHARARGAGARFDLAGYASNCDGVHITNPDAAGQARAMRAALADAGLDAGAIGYLNAHGTATLAGDAVEAESIAAVFGADGVPVSSTKAIHGHLLGAGGAIELLATWRAIDAGQLPPTANVERADPAFAIDLVTGGPRESAAIVAAMSSSFAFGGTNAVLIATRAARATASF
jgi:3-oxoacyl-[acyl-carrier-protein] synthase II